MHEGPSSITPKETYLNRRAFIAAAGSMIAAFGRVPAAEPLPIVTRMVTTTDPMTPYNVVTTYNNF